MKKHHSKPQPGAPGKDDLTIIVGRCTLAEGDYVQVAERTYVILGID